MKILVINGPNLNMLGIREPEIYSTITYTDLVNQLIEYGSKKRLDLECFQSNHEGAIIDKIHEAYFKKFDGIIINAGAFTHYSYAILDALKAVSIPTIEVHLSDITKREDFRKQSVIRDACVNSFFGKGISSYYEAIDYLVEKK